MALPILAMHFPIHLALHLHCSLLILPATQGEGEADLVITDPEVGLVNSLRLPTT